MVDKEFIRKQHLREGWSLRKIARQTGMCRKTIRRMLRDSEIPTYVLSKPRPRPSTGPYLEIIRTWLREDLTAPRKQRHTAKRVYDRLVREQGFTGSESNIRKVVAKLKKEIAPERGFVPLAAEPGEQAQVDWGEAFVRIGGEERKVYLFCMRLRHSGTPFVRAFPDDGLEAFLAGHRLAFESFGGVPRECVYDNLRSAVSRVLPGPNREENRHFSALRGHYLFDSRFCNVRSGNEKGSVENLVGCVRRNALVPVPDLATLEDLNALLEDWCGRQRQNTSFEEEALRLLPLPAVPHPCALQSVSVVSKTSLVRFEGNVYSVPTGHEREAVDLLLTWDRVRISRQGKAPADHPRLSGKGKASLELAHYLPLLRVKPGAVRNARVVRELEEPWQRARRVLCARPEGYRELCALLQLHRDHPHEDLTRALEEALSLKRVTAETVRQLLLNRTPSDIPAASVPDSLASLSVPTPDPGRYDALLREQVA